MEEIRIDCSKFTPDQMEQAKKQAQTLFKLNHTMPMTQEYDALVHELFPTIGEGSIVNTPLTVVVPENVKIGKGVIVMNGCLLMSASGLSFSFLVLFFGFSFRFISFLYISMYSFSFHLCQRYSFNAFYSHNEFLLISSNPKYGFRSYL